jgi:hypothetical protein
MHLSGKALVLRLEVPCALTRCILASAPGALFLNCVLPTQLITGKERLGTRLDVSLLGRGACWIVLSGIGQHRNITTGSGKGSTQEHYYWIW